MNKLDRINQALQQTPREEFLPSKIKAMAEIDAPIPIGYGQTNSQPYTVKKMLEWLGAGPGETVLDVGSGSGWTTALLSNIVGDKGKVIAVERIPELVQFGKENCQKLELGNVEFHQAGKKFGWPKQAPYKRILVSAAPSKLPAELIDQLELGGRMVIPVQNDIIVIDKDEQGQVSKTEHSGFAFVPLLP